MRHYPKEVVWKRTISYFFAIFKGLTNKLIPTMNSYVSEAEYEEMMDAENAQFGELKAVPVSALLSIDNETASNMLFLLMEKAQYLDLACRVKSGMAYYEFEDVNNVKRRLYLNSDIVDFVITYLMCGNKRSYYPKINNIDKNVDEAISCVCSKVTGTGTSVDIIPSAKNIRLYISMGELITAHSPIRRQNSMRN
jgi:hypothetical protein